MDINELHSALANLAATTPDEPGLLTAIHRDARRSHRRRATLVGGSALVVTGAAVAVAAGGFPATGHPLLPTSSPRTTTTVKPAQSAPPPAPCAGGGAGASAGAVPTIVSWTGSPPAVGQTFNVTGTATAAAAGTVTVVLNGGDAGGTVTLTTQTTPPDPMPKGATVQLGGTRTGQDAYEVTSMSVTSGGMSMGFSTSSASSVGGIAGSARTGAAPTIVCVGQGAQVRSHAPAP